MVFKNNFIAVVRSGGRILREVNGEVRLPFGSEYSILLKNKDSRKAVASISIDGQSVTNGRIIVDGGSQVELLGFLEGISVRNKFRFIQKTAEIAEHRGDNVDDGIVTVEYWFEERVEVTKQRYDVVRGWGGWYPYDYYSTPMFNDTSYTFTTSNCVDYHALTASECVVAVASVLPDEGITVKGSEVNQTFSYGNTKSLEEQSSVINIVLKGYKDSGVKVERAVTTSQKIQCPTCGRSTRSSAKYCSNCSTYLR